MKCSNRSLIVAIASSSFLSTTAQPESYFGGYLGWLSGVSYNKFFIASDTDPNMGVAVHWNIVNDDMDTGDDAMATIQLAVVAPANGWSAFGLAEPVAVIQENLHMHKTGLSMANLHLRNGEVIRQGTVEFWDFEQQGDITLVQPPYQLLPGDSFRTVCNYNSDRPILWGPGSNDEMCLATITYYPRKIVRDGIDGVPITCGLGIGDVLPGCEATYNVTPDVTTFDQLERTFGSVPSSCPKIETGTQPQSPPVAIPSESTSFAVSITSKVFLHTYIGIVCIGAIVVSLFE